VRTLFGYAIDFVYIYLFSNFILTGCVLYPFVSDRRRGARHIQLEIINSTVIHFTNTKLLLLVYVATRLSTVSHSACVGPCLREWFRPPSPSVILNQFQ